VTKFVTPFASRIFVRAIDDGSEERIQKAYLVEAKLLILYSTQRPSLMPDILDRHPLS
jgi:hypothetical protein